MISGVIFAKDFESLAELQLLLKNRRRREQSTGA